MDYELLHVMDYHGKVEQIINSYVSDSCKSYQVVVWFDAEQIPEVAESQRGVGLEAKVWIVMCGGQVASLTAMCDE